MNELEKNPDQIKPITLLSVFDLESISDVKTPQHRTPFKSFYEMFRKNIPPFFDRILAHPNFKSIPADGEFALGRIVLECVRKQKVDLLRVLEKHPNFSLVPMEGSFSFCHAINEAVSIITEAVIRRKESRLQLRFLSLPKPDCLEFLLKYVPEELDDQETESKIGEFLLILALENKKKLSDYDGKVAKILLDRRMLPLVSL